MVFLRKRAPKLGTTDFGTVISVAAFVQTLGYGCASNPCGRSDRPAAPYSGFIRACVASVMASRQLWRQSAPTARNLLAMAVPKPPSASRARIDQVIGWPAVPSAPIGARHCPSTHVLAPCTDGLGRRNCACRGHSVGAWPHLRTKTKRRFGNGLAGRVEDDFLHRFVRRMGGRARSAGQRQHDQQGQRGKRLADNGSRA